MQNRKRKWLKRATAMIVSAVISLTCAIPAGAEISSGSSAKINKQYVKYAHLGGSKMHLKSKKSNAKIFHRIERTLENTWFSRVPLAERMGFEPM